MSVAEPVSATQSRAENVAVGRDESRLSMIAYWLERYRHFDKDEVIRPKYELLTSKLETQDAKDVAAAWFDEKPIGPNNRFYAVADRIRKWARATQGR